jgi:hypothetical protein
MPVDPHLNRWSLGAATVEEIARVREARLISSSAWAKSIGVDLTSWSMPRERPSQTALTASLGG